jgi:Domain of unknown function (DUF5753)
MTNAVSTSTRESADTIPHDWLREFTEKAFAVQYWALHTLPEMLQTEAYARALHACLLPAPGEQEIGKRIAVMREQQALLTAESGPQMTFIVDESVLRRIVGGRHVMSMQLEHVWKCARLPRVTLQVAPLNVPHHPGLHRSATVIETRADRMVFLEDHDGTATPVTDAQRVSALAQHITLLRSYALTPEQSLDLIADIHEKQD